MTDIYLVRHGESYGNLYSRLNGIWDAGLTKRGEYQASLVADRFRATPLDIIYSSPLQRARSTAQAIADAKGMTVTVVDDLHEQNMGCFESLSWHEARALYPEEHIAWMADRHYYPCPGGESEHEAGLRLKGALERLAAGLPDGSFLAVTHAVALNGFIESAFPGKSKFGTNTAVSHVRRDSAQGIWEDVLLQDSAHLPQVFRERKRKWFEGWSNDDYSLLFRDEAAGEDHGTVAGYSRGERVGYLSYAFDGDACKILDLRIEPKYLRCMYASQLIGEIRHRAEKRGLGRLKTTLAGGDDAWAACLDRHGFTLDGATAVKEI
ncbi:MAG: histidine phosphatase family protein [Lachnospiraceae bacterium]|jgi:probable phosphoglycerate mutase|nr:histidine phosphatase family protein [Lachnospiraceae bacterium]